MPMIIRTLLSDYLVEIKKIYGFHLRNVILYGSYARGDYTVESDIDIMILVDLFEEEIDKYSDELTEVGFEYNVAYGIWVMPIVKNEEHFRHWVKANPFYENVQQEGIMIYGVA